MVLQKVRIVAGHLESKGNCLPFVSITDKSISLSPPLAGLDYNSVLDRQLLFSDTNAMSEVIVSIVNDSAVENVEQFFAALTIESTETRGVILAPIEATIDIQDNDGL